MIVDQLDLDGEIAGLLSTPEEVAEALDKASVSWQPRLLHGAPVVAVDCETTGLSPRDDRIRLLQLSDGEQTFVVDLWRHEDIEPLREILTDQGTMKVLQNAKFDWQFLKWNHDIEVSPLFDTMIAAHLLGNQGSAGLESLARNFLDVELPKDEQRSNWKGELSPSQISYAAKDAEILLPLRRALATKLEEEGLIRVAKVEFACLPVIAQMELNGMKLDLDQIEKLRIIAEAEKRNAHLAFEEYLPDIPQQLALGDFDPQPRVNLGSPKQVTEVFAKLGVVMDGTGVDVLKKCNHPAAKVLLEHRKHKKRLDAFLDPLPKLIHPVTGRIHPTFNQARVVTGRISHSKPNVAQIPREQSFRDCFVAEEGNKIVTADFQGQELRILAELSDDEAMKKAFTEGIDLHTFSSSKMYGIAMEDVTKEQRTTGKTCSFALLYGAGPGRIAGLLGVSPNKATELMDAYFDAYPRVRKWMDKVSKEGVRNGYIRTLSGRRIPLTDGDKNRAGREAINYSIQGLAADMTKMALYLTEKKLKVLRDAPTIARNASEGLFEAMLINSVHDELVIECGEDWGDTVEHVVHAAMVEAGELFLKEVPIEAEVEVAKVWKK